MALRGFVALAGLITGAVACGTDTPSDGASDPTGGGKADGYNSSGVTLPLPPPCAAGASAVDGCYLPVPLIRQLRDYTCGDVSLLSILRYWNAADFTSVTERDLIAPLKTSSDNGTEPDDIVAFIETAGDPRVARLHAEKRENLDAAELEDALRAGLPVITDIEAWQAHTTFKKFTPWETDLDDGHYVVLIGAGRAIVDAPHVREPWLPQPDVCGQAKRCLQDVYYFMDPSTTGYYTYIPKAELVNRWHDVENDVPIQHLAIFITPDAAVTPTPYDLSTRHEPNAKTATPIN